MMANARDAAGLVGVAVAPEANPLATGTGPITPPSRTMAMATKVNSEFTNFKSKLQIRHQTWIEIEANYNGRYLKEIQEGSNVFMRMTRLMVSLAMAKILPIALPNTGLPWDVETSPIPDIEGVDPSQAMEFAQAAAAAMRKRIEDNFEEMRFYEQLPQALLEACLYGTMVWRGPLGSSAKKSHWAFTEETDPNTGQKIQGYKKVTRTDSKRPEHKHISLWSAYPDPGAKSINDCSAVIVRHLLTQHQLREMAESGEFDADEIYALITENPNGNFVAENHESQRFSINQDQLTALTNRYVVLERWGFLSGHDLQDAGVKIADDDVKTQKMFQTWVCGNHVIKNEEASYFKHPPFIFCPYEIVPQSLLGRGVGEQCMDTQTATNSLVRGLIDSMAWAIGPQVEVDAAKTQPGANGYVSAPRQVWVKRRTELPDDGQPAVRFTDVPFHGDAILNALNFFQNMYQMQTGIAFSNGGMVGPGMSGIRTIGQQTQVYQNAEAFAQLVIKNLDTFFFTPMVRDHYDWEMNFNPDISLKGDFQVSASGIRGAMAREIAIQKRMDLLNIFNGNPKLSDRVNISKWVTAFMRDLDLPDEGFIYSDEEYAKVKQQETELEAQKEQAMAEARRFKAETPVKDALVTLASRIPDTNPAFAPAYAEAFRALGSDSPQLYVALSAIAQKVAVEYEQAGYITPEDAQTLEEDFTPPTSSGVSSPPDRAAQAPAPPQPSVPGAPAAGGMNPLPPQIQQLLTEQTNAGTSDQAQ